ncbi:hypothetical protein SAMN06297251_105211 [Fulvimarina manganoxydans]|uniref:Uncharacterized protein n=2 Tax=Fulvimarina manganoxydans TaxID=937218 RepID=A0A1W2B0Z3_9HYPH|nr:hypothetical protein SAMN06297251_105211 [Fulvimarina manganoxydans]
MTPRIGPSLEKGRSKAVSLILLGVTVVFVVTLLVVGVPGDQTATDSAFEPHMEANSGSQS